MLTFDHSFMQALLYLLDRLYWQLWSHCDGNTVHVYTSARRPSPSSPTQSALETRHSEKAGVWGTVTFARHSVL
jgi:hypothetical protein